MKKFMAILILLTLVLGSIPATSMAVAKQMRDGVPVWTEETVKQYALDFIRGNDTEKLFGYYDLQIRRYMPMDTYTGMLTEIEWMTGDFVDFGTYTNFEEPAEKTKTHVLHLCMEKRDLDLYFTHKNKDDDWEVMAVEFVPAATQEPATTNDDAMILAEEDEDTDTATYTEIKVQVGTEPYMLDGILTMPEGASADNKVPGVVLVHGSGPNDMDETIGQTKLFADIAKAFAKKGIATLRYHKRTYTYGSTMTAEEIQNLTVEEETIEDAISAGQMLKENESVDANCVVVLGHSMGAMLAPRIVSESKGVFTAMILVAGSPKSLLDIMLDQNEALLTKLDGETLTTAEAQVKVFKEEVTAVKKARKADTAKTLTVAGINGYYFWEMMQVDPIKLIIKLRKPTYIVQGTEDFQVTSANGIDAYDDELSGAYKFVDYKLFRKLNHLLMQYTGTADTKGTVAEYDTPATLDKQAGRNLADWVLSLRQSEDEE